MHVRLIGDSKLSVGVSVSVRGCLHRLSLCGPVMDWQPVQDAPRLLPSGSWDRLQSHCKPGFVKAVIEEGWMDEWLDSYDNDKNMSLSTCKHDQLLM